MINLFKHLLPRAEAWRITFDKKLRDLFAGLAGAVEDLIEFFDLVWFDMFPTTTRELTAWEAQFGLPTNTGLTEAERRTRLAVTWSETGGQDPRYIQDTLQAAGFDVYVYEWWVAGTDPPVARDPEYYLGDQVPTYHAGYLLVNKKYLGYNLGGTDCGELHMECGEPSAICGEGTGLSFTRFTYPMVEALAEFPYVMYISGENLTKGYVPTDRFDEFEDLCLKICPAHLWIGVLVGSAIAFQVYQSSIPNVIIDGNMEMSGIGGWAGTPDVLTIKYVGSDVYDGVQSLHVLSQVTNGDFGAYNIQNLTPGTAYGVRGAARVTGSVLSRVYQESGTTLWEATAGNYNWQTFSEVFICEGLRIYFGGPTVNAVGDRVEFDAIEIVEEKNIFSFTLGVGGEVVVDWGDGSETTVTGDGIKQVMRHAYFDEGLFSVRITGDIDQITQVKILDPRVRGDVFGFSAAHAMIDLRVSQSSMDGDFRHLNSLENLTYLDLEGLGVDYHDKPTSPTTLPTTVDLPPWSDSNLELADNALSATEVDNFFGDLADAGGTDGVLAIAGDNAAPTTVSDVDYDTLIDNEWDIDESGKTFVVLNGESGVGELSTDIEPSGDTEETATLWYNGTEATASAWASEHSLGETLTVAGSGSDPVPDKSTPFTDGTESTELQAAKYYQAPTATTGDIGTEDVIIQLVFKTGDLTGSKYIISKYSTSAGWDVYTNGTNLAVFLSDGTNFASISAAIEAYTWYHAVIVIEAGGTMNMYLDGFLSSTTSISAVGSLSDATVNLKIGATTGGSNPTDARIALFAMWIESAWLSSASQLALAAEQHCTLTGFSPSIAAGTTAPLARTRAFSAHMDLLYQSDELLTDGDMATPGVAAWTAGNSATLTKNTSNPHDGYQCLKVAYNGTPNPYASQAVLNSNGAHVVEGWARGSGTVAPKVLCGSSQTLWTGTISAEWQYFKVPFIAEDDNLRLEATTSVAGYAEFDAVTVFEHYIRLEKVGSEWLRFCKRLALDGEVAKGYLPEIQSTNSLPYSEGFASWTAVSLVATNNVQEAPDGRTAAAKLVGASGSSVKSVRQSVTLTSGNRYTLSVFAAPEAVDWIKIAYNDAGGSNKDAFFNVSTGEIGTVGASAEARIYGPYAGGFYRVAISFVAETGALPIDIFIADGDGDDTTVGDGSTTDLYVWGAQLEGTTIPTSYIFTNGATATRLKDQLQYKGDDGNITTADRGSIKYQTLSDSLTSGPYQNFIPMSINTAGSAEVIVSYAGVAGRPYFFGRSAYVTLWGFLAPSGTAIFDRYIHEIVTIWREDKQWMIVDDGTGVSAISATVPSGYNYIDIGQDRASAGQFMGLVFNVRVSKR